jgi:hypothetical protein
MALLGTDQELLWPGALNPGGYPPLRSSLLVGGAVTIGNSGPYTTDFNLIPALTDVNKSIAIPLTLGAQQIVNGGSVSGDYLKWAFTSTSNFRVSALQTGATGTVPCFWLILEFYSVKGKNTASTNITGTTAADFDVAITPPSGASIAKCIYALTCYPLNSGGNPLIVAAKVPNTTTFRFSSLVTATGNTTKPVQGEILWF